MRKHTFSLTTDYHQFYIQDDDMNKGDLSDSWDEEATNRLLAVSRYAIGVGTVRSSGANVIVEIHDVKPDINLDSYDRVNHCSIEIETGRIVVAGCTDYFPDAQRINVEPGIYEAFICYKDLHKISEDGLDGEESYSILLYHGIHKKIKELKK